MAVQSVSGQTLTSVNLTELGQLVFNAAGPYNIQSPTTIGNTYTAATGGAAHLDTVWAHSYSLASTTATINLFDGSLTSPSGLACVFARVRIFLVTVTDSTSTHLISVQSGASSGVLWLPPAASTLFCPPGATIKLEDLSSITTAGFLVDTSHKNITFDSGALTVAFNVVIAGNSSAA